MRPKTDAVVYRPDLGAMVLEYAEGPSMGFIGYELFPVFPSPMKEASFPVVPKEALLKLNTVDRAPRGRYNRDDFEYERGTYRTSEKGWEEPVDDDERATIEGEIYTGVADEIAVERAWGTIMRAAEYRIAQKIQNTNNFTAHAVTTEWDTAATCTPVDDVNDGVSAVRSACGMVPNTLVIAWQTFQDLKNCDQVVDRLKYTFPGIDINRMNVEQLAAVFNISRVLVGGAVYDSAGKGIASTVTDMWSSEYAFLTITDGSRDLRRPSLGRTFLWTADSPQNPVVESYREEQIRSDIFRVRHHVDECFIQSKDSDGTAVSTVYDAVSYLFSNIHT